MGAQSEDRLKDFIKKYNDTKDDPTGQYWDGSNLVWLPCPLLG